jgi:hypothetical protein
MARQADAVDLMIAPDLGDHGVFECSKFSQLAEASEAAAENAEPALKELLTVPGN